jgi:hypothetical protein
MNIWILSHGGHPLNAILLPRHLARPRPQLRLLNNIRGFEFHIHCLQRSVELSVVNLEYAGRPSTMNAQRVTTMPCTPADGICRLSTVSINQQYSLSPIGTDRVQHCVKRVQHIVVVRTRLACRHRQLSHGAQFGTSLRNRGANCLRHPSPRISAPTAEGFGAGPH